MYTTVKIIAVIKPSRCSPYIIYYELFKPLGSYSISQWIYLFGYYDIVFLIRNAFCLFFFVEYPNRYLLEKYWTTSVRVVQKTLT